MQTKKFLLAPAMLLAFFAISATNPPAKEETKAAPSEEANQCGVSNAAIQRYLETCSHHHTVYNVWDIPGGCNSAATIEDCGTATVYVSGGCIVGHSDAAGFCD